MYCGFLEEQNKSMEEKSLENNTYNESLFEHNMLCYENPNCQKNVTVETDMRMNGYNSKLNCKNSISKKKNVSFDVQCVGYDCKNHDSFLVQPDDFNTSHNYSVLQEKQINGKDVYCTNNHQYFNNFTRRYVGVTNNSTGNNGGLPPDSEKIPELQFNKCDLYPNPVEMKCSFP
jgi:hypothetical protein